jgi:hypothetical protein
MMQPSANGIASLFQGNPAALQQRVQKEEQAKPGLPPDLTELMALQILTEKTDAAQRQMAMNQLQQAGGANMPTVAQTLQERAKQALQARMMQAQQQAQQPPQPQPIPTAPPADQPEASPEMLQQLAALQAQGKGGLDQLPANVGNYAGGGIIAFNGEERSDVPDEKLTPEEAQDILERMRARTMPQAEPSEDRDRLERELEMRRIAARAAANQPLQPRVVSEVPPGGPDLPRGIAGARRYPKPPEARMEPPAPPAAPPTARPATPPQPRPSPMGILTPEQASQVKQVQLDRLNLNPYERERLAREEAEKFVGAPETASLQSLADELAAKRQRIAQRQQENKGFDALMRNIAAAPRGLTSAAAGVFGSERMRATERELETQDFETLKSMLETQAKISDVKRGWKKDLFTIGKAEFDKVYKDNYDAAKELNKSDAEAKKLAQEAVLEADRQANALKVAGIYAAPQQAANARIEKAIQSMLKKPGNEKMTYDEALLAVTSPTSYLAPDKQTLGELKALAENLRAMADPMKNPDPDSQKEAARQLALVTAKMAKMGGVDLGGASVPPPGAVRLKQ